MYKNVLIILVLLVLTGLGQAQTIKRSSWHCGTEIIKPGSSCEKLLYHCGEADKVIEKIGPKDVYDLRQRKAYIYYRHNKRIIFVVNGLFVTEIIEEDL